MIFFETFIDFLLDSRSMLQLDQRKIDQTISDFYRQGPRELVETPDRGAQHAASGAEGARPEAGQQREHRKSRNRRSLQ